MARHFAEEADSPDSDGSRHPGGTGCKARHLATMPAGTTALIGSRSRVRRSRTARIVSACHSVLSLGEWEAIGPDSQIGAEVRLRSKCLRQPEREPVVACAKTE